MSPTTRHARCSVGALMGALLLLAVSGCLFGPSGDEMLTDREIISAIETEPETIEKLRSELSKRGGPEYAAKTLTIAGEGSDGVRRWREIEQRIWDDASQRLGWEYRDVEESIVWMSAEYTLENVIRVREVTARSTGMEQVHRSGSVYTVFEDGSGKFLGWLAPRPELLER